MAKLKGSKQKPKKKSRQAKATDEILDRKEQMDAILKGKVGSQNDNQSKEAGYSDDVDEKNENVIMIPSTLESVKVFKANRAYVFSATSEGPEIYKKQTKLNHDLGLIYSTSLGKVNGFY